MITPLSFTSSYKVKLSENGCESSDIYSAMDKIFKRTYADPSVEFGTSKNNYDTIWRLPVDDKYDSFVEATLASRGIKFTKKNFNELFDTDNIKKRIVLPELYYSTPFELVEVDTKRFNDAYRKSDFGYVGDGENVVNKTSYNSVEEYIKTDNPINASIVFIKDKGDRPDISFQDGRHRYAYMRNFGMKRIPLAMDENSKKVAIKYNLV